VEVLLVDDGSKDTTLNYIKKMTEEYPESSSLPTCFVTGVRQVVNRGKGAAVKIGTLYSRGEFVLMLDADGATDYKEIEQIFTRAKQT
jgi:dolichyl-phosphate beta-glucosyltransferase